jgi:hypothetical protein
MLLSIHWTVILRIFLNNTNKVSSKGKLSISDVSDFLSIDLSDKKGKLQILTGNLN